jgi:hypothetical protein
LITSTCVGGHDANATTTVSSDLEFVLSSLTVASDEKYESIPNDKITLLTSKFCKERRRSFRNSFECGDTTHFITDSSNK